MSGSKRIVEEGKNAWRIAPANRAAFLVDGAAYFEAVAAAFELAEESIFILGWDFNGDVTLRRDGDEGGLELGSLLFRLLSSRRRLRVYILVWDFAMVFALERDWLPLFDVALSGKRRLHFRMDDRHPVGASHHQKIVVVDDALAFAGGLDLTKNRWDTPDHAADDPRRLDTKGQAYAPFHDVQVAVDGEAAAALGELARQRWRRATGRRISSRGNAGAERWPSELVPDVENLDVAISRTLPAHEDQDEVREVEALFLDAIASAERYIYIENQYLTSDRIREALAARLAEENGPEIVMVMPKRCTGWLEENTMGLLRSRILEELRESDRGRRFRVYAPMVPGSESCEVFVHSKVLVVDDKLVRIGSANLSNRSMGLDSECDVAIEANGRAHVERAVARFRNRLLGEHLGVSPDEISTTLASEGSLVATVEKMRSGARTLDQIEPESGEWSESLAEAVSVVDPESPVSADELLQRFAPEDAPRTGGRAWLGVGAFVAVLLALAALWRWTPLREVASIETLGHWAQSLRGEPLALLVVTGAFVLGELLLFPLTLLIAATAVTFEPLTAIVYALAGTLASAGSTYWLGRWLGRNTIRRLLGGRLNRMSRHFKQRGFLTMTVVRLVPVAPFSVVNLVAGASRIRFRDFLAGSALGIMPGILAVTLMADRVEGALRDPSFGSLALLGGAVLVVAAGIAWVRRRFGDSDDT